MGQSLLVPQHGRREPGRDAQGQEPGADQHGLRPLQRRQGRGVVAAADREAKPGRHHPRKQRRVRRARVRLLAEAAHLVPRRPQEQGRARDLRAVVADRGGADPRGRHAVADRSQPQLCRAHGRVPGRDRPLLRRGRL